MNKINVQRLFSGILAYNYAVVAFASPTITETDFLAAGKSQLTISSNLTSEDTQGSFTTDTGLSLFNTSNSVSNTSTLSFTQGITRFLNIELIAPYASNSFENTTTDGFYTVKIRTEMEGMTNYGAAVNLLIYDGKKAKFSVATNTNFQTGDDTRGQAEVVTNGQVIQQGKKYGPGKGMKSYLLSSAWSYHNDNVTNVIKTYFIFLDAASNDNIVQSGDVKGVDLVNYYFITSNLITELRLKYSHKDKEITQNTITSPTSTAQLGLYINMLAIDSLNIALGGNLGRTFDVKINNRNTGAFFDFGTMKSGSFGAKASYAF